MASPSEKLAQSLKVLRALQDRGAIRAADLSRVHRERLVANGFLRLVMKGWYVASRPDQAEADGTAWYASFWDFCAGYLGHRFGANWCLSPEQSLRLHAGNRAVPSQLLVRAPKARNNVTKWPHGTSLLDVRAAIPEPKDIEETDGLRLFSLPAALVACAPGFFTQCPTDARAALLMVGDSSEVLARLLDGGHSFIAGRLAGGFRNIGRNRIAYDITATFAPPAMTCVKRIRSRPDCRPPCPAARPRPGSTEFVSCGKRCARRLSSGFRRHRAGPTTSTPI